MEELINRLIASDLKDLEGLKISGTIPVTERLVNELAADYIREFFAGEAAANKPAIDPERPDYAAIIRRLRLNQFNVRFEQGRMVLHLDIGR